MTELQHPRQSLADLVIGFLTFAAVATLCTFALPLKAGSLLTDRGEVLMPVPLKGPTRIITHFGEQVDPLTGETTTHIGVDLEATRGTPVLAVESGTVLRSEVVEGYGRMVEIEYDQDVRVIHAHLTNAVVQPGDLVIGGLPIGTVGNTGLTGEPHLHLEVYVKGKPVDPGLHFNFAAHPGS